jgi:hypothetical protein
LGQLMKWLCRLHLGLVYIFLRVSGLKVRFCRCLFLSATDQISCHF